MQVANKLFFTSIWGDDIGYYPSKGHKAEVI